MTGIMNYGLSRGFELVLMARFELEDAIKLIRRTRPTILPGVPTLFNALMNHPKVTSEDLKSLRHCISGGAPLPLEIRTGFETLASCQLVEGYGLSETSPVATTNPPGGLVKENSIGQPVPQTIISIRDLEEPTREMPLGEDGEVSIAGPQVMKGYWKNEEATKSTFTGEYFRTGDVGHFDEDGFIYLIDRIKDIIICSGFNVYPRRIEDAIYEFPAVEEVTVIGVPDEYRGEAPKAFVKLKPGMTASAEELLIFPQAEAFTDRNARSFRVSRRVAEDNGREAVEEGIAWRRGRRYACRVEYIFVAAACLEPLKGKTPILTRPEETSAWHNKHCVT